MLVLWMGYAVLVGLLVTAAAALFDRGIRRRRRWLWAGAMLGTAVLPLVTPPLRRLVGPSATLDVVFGPILPVAADALEAWGVAAASSVATLDLDRLLLGAWLGASAVLAALLVGGVLRVRRLRRSWRAARVDGTDVLVSERFGPAVAGLLHPEIVLPEWALALTEPERGLILAHEEEHRRGGDPALLAAAAAVPVLLPWNPVAWALFLRLRHAVETDCDARVLERVGRPALDYARLLVEVSTRNAEVVPVGAGFGDRASSLERRIRTILGGAAGLGWKGLTARAAVAALLLTGACSLDVSPTGLTPTSEARTAGGPQRAMPTPEEIEAMTKRPLQEIREAPTFTPFTVAPTILNREEVVAAFAREYPPLLRDAGIEGTVRVYFLLDAEGRVDRTILDRSSGHQALDEAALRVASVYRFSPALNRDVKVPVWVSFPITFQTR